MALIKCSECKNKISDKATICPKCGCPVEKKLFCKECGKEINLNDEYCKNCGFPISTTKNDTSKKSKNSIINNKKHKKIGIIIGIILIILIIIIVFSFKTKPKIDETATTISQLSRLELIYGEDINFNDIISGGNCISGRQTITIKSEKYGIVTAEYYYCKLKNDVYLHIYN